MYTIGLTGGSGAGKGYAAEIFRSTFGVPYIDTDRVYRELCVAGSDCLRELASGFGCAVLSPDGSLDRAELSRIVFADKNKLLLLNSITHKYILNRCREWLNEKERRGEFAAIVDAPQLFESGFNLLCDFTVAVIADKNVRIRRITERDGVSAEKAAARINSQLDDDFFIDRCDFIIVNNGPERLDLQIDLIYQQIRWV